MSDAVGGAGPCIGLIELASIAAGYDTTDALMKEARVDSLYVVMKSAEQVFKDVYNPRFTVLMEGSRDAIRLVMTPAQVAHYDSLLADSDRRRNSGTGAGPR